MMKIIKTSKKKAEHVVDSARFVGSVNYQGLLDETVAKTFRAFFAHFEPGNRTTVHTHPSEQILFVTGGKGMVGTDTEEHVVTPGALIFIGAGERHWHGATSNTSFSHLAVLIQDKAKQGAK